MNEFININIENYDYVRCENLFSLVVESVNILLPTTILDIVNASMSGEAIHIIIACNNSQYSLNNKLSILFTVEDFIVQSIEVSLLH